MATTMRNRSLLQILIRQSTGTRSLQSLAFDEIQPSNETPFKFTAFVLHGLLGSSRNLRSFSRTLASSLSNASSTGWRMVLVDLRNHGRSAEIKGLSPPHDMVNAANDVANLVKAQGWASPDVIIGHSMGGKVALQFAHSCARAHYGHSLKLPKQLWILDSVPGKVHPNSKGEIEQILQTLQSLPSSFPSRKWLVDHMMKLGYSKSLSEWVGSNLKKSGENQTWVFNLEDAIQMFNSFREMDYWPLLENPPNGLEISIVRAENSDRWDPGVVQQLESLVAAQKVDQSEGKGKVSVHLLPKAGHWVHVDNPKGLVEIMTPKMASLV